MRDEPKPLFYIKTDKDLDGQNTLNWRPVLTPKGSFCKSRISARKIAKDAGATVLAFRHLTDLVVVDVRFDDPLGVWRAVHNPIVDKAAEIDAAMAAQELDKSVNNVDKDNGDDIDSLVR